jgi:carbamate kinase
LGKSVVPAHPLDIVGAMTQGQIGYMLQETLTNNLQKLGINKPVIAIINRVLVDKSDPQFYGDAASKPVGDFFTENEAKELKKQNPDYILKRVKPNSDKSWRRVVPSPNPIRNIEAEGIRKMVDEGIVVIASGGGGIPVIQNEHGEYEGVEAVIDKDLAGQLLAEVVGADIFLILTDVQKVKLNFGRPDETEINIITISQAKTFLEEGHFLDGSMGPKVEACIRFLNNGGKRAIITSLDCALEALDGETGTHIIPIN